MPLFEDVTHPPWVLFVCSAFWWIAGDCLGFRRADAKTKAGTPYKFASSLLYENVITYKEQLEILTHSGFALWDIIESCERPGSLDSDISKDQPNDIRGFCQAHPTVKRIVLANGQSGCKFFSRHFKDWLGSGELTLVDEPKTQKALCKYLPKDSEDMSSSPIQLVGALAVSPAAASYSYEEKRDFWMTHVYEPGLKH